jgi:NADPH:quinone reductase-like Zn-dependent oxidoreductase
LLEQRTLRGARLNYSREDVVARVKEITSGKNAPVEDDAVSKDTRDRSLDCPSPLGLMVSFGNESSGCLYASLLIAA